MQINSNMVGIVDLLQPAYLLQAQRAVIVIIFVMMIIVFSFTAFIIEKMQY